MESLFCALSLCGRSEGRNQQLQLTQAPGAVDLPLFDCFVLVHIDGGDGMLGARLHLPVHLPLGVFRLGLEQVHPLLCFDPAGNGEGRRGGKKKRRVNFIRGGDLCARSGVSAPMCAAVLLFSIASWQKQFHR